MSAEDRVAYWKRRARDAEWELRLVAAERSSTERWAREAFAEQRRLSDRLNQVIGLAMTKGMTLDDLRAFNDSEATP